MRCCSPPPSYPRKALSPPGGPSARPEVSLMVLADGVGWSRGVYIPVPAVPLQVLTGRGARPGASSRPRGPSPPSPARPLFPGRPARGGAVSRGPLAWATVTGSLPHTFRPLCGLTFHPTTPPAIPSGSRSSRPQSSDFDRQRKRVGISLRAECGGRMGACGVSGRFWVFIL